MKKLTFVFILVASVVFAQSSSQGLLTVNNSAKLAWSGIDFSEVQLIESTENPGFNEPERIQNYFLKAWNEIVFSEPDKFNFKDFYDKETVDINVTEAIEFNSKVDIENRIIRDASKAPSPLKTNEELQAIVDKYTFEGVDGITSMLIVTEMSKVNAQTTAYMVFIDVSTKKIIYSREEVSKAGGFGFKNYWLGSFFRIYEEISFRTWLKEDAKKNKKR